MAGTGTVTFRIPASPDRVWMMLWLAEACFTLAEITEHRWAVRRRAIGHAYRRRQLARRRRNRRR
jgi:hypothetical protein